MKIGTTKTDKRYHKLIWLVCIDCGKARWVELIKGKPKRIRCLSCAMKRVTNKPVIIFPLRSDKEAYIQSYGKDLENHFDGADRTLYKNRIFCLDCPNFKLCRGSLWKHCPTKAEVLELIKGV